MLLLLLLQFVFVFLFFYFFTLLNRSQHTLIIHALETSLAVALIFYFSLEDEHVKHRFCRVQCAMCKKKDRKRNFLRFTYISSVYSRIIVCTFGKSNAIAFANSHSSLWCAVLCCAKECVRVTNESHSLSASNTFE